MKATKIDKKVMASIQEGFNLVQAGKGKWKDAAVKLAERFQREDFFTADFCALVPGWPVKAKGKSLSQARLSGECKDDAVFRSLNAFSTWFYGNTRGTEPGKGGRLTKGEVVFEKPEPKETKKQKQAKAVAAKDATLPQLVESIKLLVSNDDDLESVGEALADLELFIAAWKMDQHKKAGGVKPVKAKGNKGKK